jgi:hypothetical protein
MRPRAVRFHLQLSLLPLSGDGGMCQDYNELSLVRDPTEPAVVLSSTTVGHGSNLKTGQRRWRRGALAYCNWTRML